MCDNVLSIVFISRPHELQIVRGKTSEATEWGVEREGERERAREWVKANNGETETKRKCDPFSNLHIDVNQRMCVCAPVLMCPYSCGGFFRSISSAHKNER